MKFEVEIQRSLLRKQIKIINTYYSVMLDNMNSLRITKFEYFIVFLLIVMCGFTSGDIIPAKSYFLSIMCIIYLVKRKNNQEIKPLLTLIIGYWIIGIMHYIEYK